jgi:hypothetical protein
MVPKVPALLSKDRQPTRYIETSRIMRQFVKALTVTVFGVGTRVPNIEFSIKTSKSLLQA